MKPRKSKRPGYTPSFPALRDALIPPSPLPVASDTGVAESGEFLSGLACAQSAEKPPGRGKNWEKIYDVFLASPRWRDGICPPIRARANGRCERCACLCDKLEIHHKTYERFGGRELPEDLEALCPSCHKKADGERKAAWAKQWAKWEDERAEERDWNRFNGWMKARHDENWSDHLSSDEVAEEREKFREMCARKREEKENQ